ncbi:SpoIIE family protein phosphatase [Amycolatopsis sacchari]|uniref:Anti-sigma regulatory factor (Ser/Thr protein kinase) n=1 Tax=Amycolatopsis sacchari TaxID=115433 RepID=A0A1I3JLT4_9PSEU|nr:SpoIIE family protein phosphatase [Amycolatopsis sacchari]SFI61239.1 Anti-sigma regulatory factor (Ser/Thr protein kinase) [Amycolatopsis sacchari]
MIRTDLVVSEDGHVGRARRLAAAVAQQQGLPMAQVHRVALAATELATNLTKHAGRGVFSVVPGPGQLDLLAVDKGPGVARMETSMRDGYSTTGTMGAGLGSIRRAADFFDAYSLPGRGTAVLARWRNGEPLSGVRVGAARLTAAGETACGDMWTAVPSGASVAVALSDGLGHGEAAAKASGAAIETVAAHASLGPARILDAMQQSLARTRGATVAVASVAPASGRLRFAGIGNIATRRYPEPGAPVQRLLSRPGIVGVAGTNRAADSTDSWSPRSWLVLQTDGVSDRWSADDWPGLLRHDPAIVAGWILGQHGRGRDDACVVAVTGGGG